MDRERERERERREGERGGREGEKEGERGKIIKKANNFTVTTTTFSYYDYFLTFEALSPVISKGRNLIMIWGGGGGGRGGNNTKNAMSPICPPDTETQENPIKYSQRVFTKNKQTTNQPNPLLFRAKQFSL